MTESGTLRVRLFGKLQTAAKERGESPTPEVEIPSEGIAAEELARRLGVSLADVEAVFCNHRVYALDHVVRPGDAVAFVPRGTPGPHRFTLGIYEAGRDRS